MAASATMVASLLGCAPGEDELVVDVRTDLVAGPEFDGIQVFVTPESRDGTGRFVSALAGPDADFLGGVRVAEFDLPPDTYRVVAQLVLGGQVVLQRPVLVETGPGVTVSTIVLSRDCRGVVCDEPGADACLGGRCVDPRCTPETSEFCETADCVADGDCRGELASCAGWTCRGGSCLVASVADACETGQYCDAARGCVSRLTLEATLVDAAAGEDVPEHSPLLPGAVVELDRLGLESATIRADIDGITQEELLGVLMSVNGPMGAAHWEEYEPWYLYGNNDTGELLTATRGRKWPPGDYVLEVEPVAADARPLPTFRVAFRVR